MNARTVQPKNIVKRERHSRIIAKGKSNLESLHLAKFTTINHIHTCKKRKITLSTQEQMGVKSKNNKSIIRVK